MDIDRGAGAYGKFGIFPPAAWPLAAAIIPTHSIWQYQYGRTGGLKGARAYPNLDQWKQGSLLTYTQNQGLYQLFLGDTRSVVCKTVFSYLCSFESNIRGEVEGP